MSKPSEKAMLCEATALECKYDAKEGLAEDIVAMVSEALAEHQRVIEMSEKALRNLVYEITHLSPQREDGAHDCRISALALRYGREGLAEIAKLRKEWGDD